MSKKELKNSKNSLEKNLMDKIYSGELTMKPRWYFTAGSLLMALSLLGISISAIFLINLCLFLAIPHGPMGEFRLQLMLSSFPWWVPVLAVIGVLAGIWLLRKYDFSYKKNFVVVSFIFVAILFIAALVIDVAGLNDTWLRHGPMRMFYQQYNGQQNGGHMGGGMMRGRSWNE